MSLREIPEGAQSPGWPRRTLVPTASHCRRPALNRAAATDVSFSVAAGEFCCSAARRYHPTLNPNRV
jgi:hypothetical protein